jgi:phosphate transport system substrate-binding protein
VCRGELKLNVSYTTTNSVQGIEAFVNALPDSDFALSGLSLTAEEREKLKQREVTPVHVPITAGSLVLVYNFWYDRDGDGKKEQVKDLRLSPSTAAKLMQGRITSWDSPEIAADNPDHKFPGRRSVPVARADNSAATWWLTSWLWETARDEYKAGGVEFEAGPTRIFPGKVGVILRTGTDAVAQYVRSFPGEQTDESGDVPFNGFIGYVYLSEAQKLGLPVASLKNAAGNYVLPTTENVAAAFAAGQVSSDGVFAPNFNSSDPKAYPIPVASYLIAASGESKGVDPTIAETIGKFVMYTNDAGQKAAISRGYVPLPDSLRSAAVAGVEKVANVPAADLAPPSSAVESAPVATSVPAALAPAAELTPVFASPDPSPSAAPTTAAAPSVARRIADAVPALAQAIAESPPVQAIKRAIAGVLGLSDVGFVPVGVPVLILGGIALLVLGRATLLRTRSTTLGARPQEPGSSEPIQDVYSIFGDHDARSRAPVDSHL